MYCPVIQLAMGDRNVAMAPPMSWGRPTRPRMFWEAQNDAAEVGGDRAGAIVFLVMPRAPTRSVIRYRGARK